MALYYVALRNPYFRVGEWVEDNGDDFVQRVRMRYEGGRYQPGGWHGICVPTHLVRPNLIKLYRNGFDQTIRRATAD